MSLSFVRFVVVQVEPDGLQLRLLVVRVEQVVASAEARLLEAAERGRDVAAHALPSMMAAAGSFNSRAIR
jgi:hypothetical protein